MDKLHRPEEFPFISEIVDVMEFFNETRALVKRMVEHCGGGEKDTNSPRNTDALNEDFARRMGIPKEMVFELEHLCDPENLKCGFEQEHDPLSDNIPKEGEKCLVTLAIQKQELKKRKSTLSYRQMATQLHKYKRTNFQLLDGFRDANDMAKLHVGYVPSDVLLTVSLARPYNRVLEYHEIRLGRLMTMDSVFHVLGCQPLTAFRDKISCICDWSVMRDVSTTTDAMANVLSKDLYPGGFFYINGVFYNDKRDPGSTDLSAPIMEWAKRRDELGPFDVADMANTRFVDLKLRLGQPYLYVHQGTCEHLMVFTDLRLMSSTDCQNVDDYPLQVSLKPKKRVRCSACKVYTAKWVMYGHSTIPFDPAFYCDQCYRSYNYDEEGRKIGDFQAMPFFDRSVLS